MPEGIPDPTNIDVSSPNGLIAFGFLVMVLLVALLFYFLPRLTINANKSRDQMMKSVMEANSKAKSAETAAKVAVEATGKWDPEDIDFETWCGAQPDDES